MISAPTYNLKGEQLEKTTLPDSLFGVLPNNKLVALAVRVYLANNRRSTAKAKTRSEVNRTTAKMYKQKGTGRARHGAASAPIFVGGGKAHGPNGLQNYTLKLSEKMKRGAVVSALSTKAKLKKILVFEGASKALGKTKQAQLLANKTEVFGKSILILTTNEQASWKRSWKNVERVTVLPCSQLNAYEINKNTYLGITPEAIAEIKEKYVN